MNLLIAIATSTHPIFICFQGGMLIMMWVAVTGIKADRGLYTWNKDNRF